MTEEFIKKYCLQCVEHVYEGYPDMGDHFCCEEVKYAEGISIPSIDEMDECPLDKGKE